MTSAIYKGYNHHHHRVMFFFISPWPPHHSIQHIFIHQDLNWPPLTLKMLTKLTPRRINMETPQKGDHSKNEISSSNHWFSRERSNAMILCQDVFSFYFSTFNPSPFSFNDLNQTHRFWKYFINLDPENKRSHDPWISLPFSATWNGGAQPLYRSFRVGFKGTRTSKEPGFKTSEETNG